MIREAVMADRLAMVRMAGHFVRDAGIGLEFCPVWAEASIKSWIEDPQKLALVLELEGAVRGMLCAAWVQSPLSPVRVASEQVLWIDPKGRGMKAWSSARGLIGAYEAWAQDQGCAVIGLASLKGQRVGMIYERCGFAPAETVFAKGLS